ncbi:MAG: hypothetical protein ABIR05_04655 [Luteimonas sp.]
MNWTLAAPRVLRLSWLMLLPALLALGACATTQDRGSALQQAQYAWSAAIRWGDIEGAWNMVDPAYRAEHPMTGMDFERYKQIQISGYHAAGETSGDELATRAIEIGVINRNTLQTRDVR